jgi:spore germination protein
VLDYATSAVDRRKILLGLPLYGYEWVESGHGRRRRSIGIGRALALAREQAAPAEYDEQREAASFRFVDSDGGRHEVWYDDERSLAAKLDLVRAFGLRGASLWRLPGDVDPALRVVRELFVTRREDASRPRAAA